MRHFNLIIVLFLFSCTNNGLNNSSNNSTKVDTTIKEKDLTKGKITPEDFKYIYRSCNSEDTSWFNLSEVDTSKLVKIDTSFFNKYLIKLGYKQNKDRRWYFKSQFDNDSIIVCTIIAIEIEDIDGKDYINGSSYRVLIINKNKSEIVNFKTIAKTDFTPSGGCYATISQRKINLFDIESFDEWAEEKTTTNTYKVKVELLDNLTFKFDTLEHKKEIK